MKPLSNTLTNGFAALLTFASRFRVFPPNFSPVGSFGFFGNNTWLYIASLVAFDVVRGGFYRGWEFTYLGFLMYPLLGRIAQKNWRQQAALLPLASFLFFLCSNFGVWWHWYPHTWQALLTCYSVALPFYTNTLLGDCCFGWGYLVAQALIRNIHNVSHKQPALAFRHA